MRPVLKSLAWLTVPIWLGPLAWWLAYQPWTLLSYAGLFLLSVELALVLGALIAAAVLLGGSVAALSRTYRPRVMLAMCRSLVFLLSFVGGLYLGRAIWRDRVEQVTARGEPLVAAIHEFTAKQGRQPEALDELTPQYLADVPTTGIGVFPEFRYVLDKPAQYDGNPWVLLVTPPCHPMGFDLLMYFPLQNYPASGYGGSIERVGTWGYVHE